MKIYCIGIGPGGEEQMTLRAVRALEACDCVAGYGLYLDLIDGLIEGKERIQTGMTREVDRCAAALERAKQGRTVAVVSSGDAGVYGMAGLHQPVRPADTVGQDRAASARRGRRGFLHRALQSLQPQACGPSRACV